MATTEQYKNGGSASYTFSIEYIKAEDIKVSVDGTDLNYTSTNPPAQTTEYTVNGSNVIFKQASVSGSTTNGVRIYRETALEDADSATFVAGSSIRATDLNANHKLVRFASQEQNQKVVTDDIRDSAVTSAKILNNTIVDADIASNAEIEAYKIKDGTANQVLITQSDGTTVGWSSSLNLPTTLQVQGNTFLDSNTNVSGDFTVLNSGTQKFKVHNSTGNTEIAGTLTVSQNISNIVGATFNNVQVGVTTGNEIDTSSGSLTLDSASGNIILDDNVRVTGTFTVDGLTTYPANVVVTGSQLKIQADNSEFAVNNGSGTTKFKVDSDNGDTLIQGTATIADIDGAAVVTSGTSTSDTKFYSAKRSDELYYRKGTADDIEESGVPWSGNDSTIATTAAIDARIIDLVDDVGGFVPVENETSFPTANPDINSPATGGTIVSVQTASTALPNGSTATLNGTTLTISNGRGSGNAVIITGVSATIPSGFGFLVETTSTDHTYAFHRLVPKATEVTTVAANNSNISTVASNIPNITAVKNNETNITTCAQNNSNIQAVAGKETEIGRLGTADAVADMAILGTTDVVADLNTLGTADVVADMNMLATSDVIADMNMLAVSDVISDMNDLATSGNITAMDTCSTNISSINNCSTNISSVNTFGDQYQVASNNPSTDGGGNTLAAGDLYFNTSANELKVYNGSSWQGGVTASGSFASVTGNTFTGDNRYNNGVKALFGTDSDIEIFHDGSDSYIKHNGAGNFYVQTSEASVEDLYLQAGNDVYLRVQTGENAIKAIGNGAVELYYDGSTNPKFQTASNGAIVTGSLGVDEIYMGDNEQIKIGAEDDFLIYHGGSENILDGVLHKIELRHGNEKHLVANPNGAVELYHNNVKKFATQSNGFEALGGQYTFYGVEGGASQLLIYADEGDDLNDRWRVMAGGSGDFVIGNLADASWDTNIKCYGSGAVELYYDDTKTIETQSTGALVTGLLNVNQGASGSSEFSGSGATTVKITAGGAGYSQLLLTKGGSSTSNNYITSDATLDLFVGNSILQLASDRSVSLPSSSSTLKFGSDGLFRLSRDTGGSQIKNLDTNGQYLNIWTDDFWVGTKDGQESYIIANHDAGVKLYHVNSKKFETTSGGLNLFGNATSNVINLRTSDNTTRGSLYASDSDIVGFLSKDGTLALTCNNTNVRVYNDLLPNSSGTGAPKIGLTGARWHEVWANDAYLSTATISDTLNVTGNATVNRLTIDDDGSSSPLCNIRSDDSGPWGLCVGNDSADTDANSSGFRVYQGNNRDIYVNLFAGWNATGYANSYIQHAYYNQSYNAISFLSNGKLQIQNSGDSIARFSTDVSGATYGSVFVNGSNGSTTAYGGISINNTVNLAGNLSDGSFGIYNQAQSDWMGWFGSNDSVYLYENGTWHLRTYASGAATNSTANDVYHTLYSNNGTTRGHVYADNSNNIGFLVNDSNWGIRINSSRQAMFYGSVLPSANNSHDLGASSYRWRNIYTNDLNLSNKGSSNDVDGTWGDWTIQEGESDLFLKNNRSGKKYKFNLTEVS